MDSDMRRGTPSAVLFGQLLAMIRQVRTGVSMREVGDRIGAPVATISQVEKGQRALKEPKIKAWSHALEVEPGDLLELWWLSQGEVLVGDRRVFYAVAGERLGTDALSASIAKELVTRPDLEPIYRLAELMTTVLRRALPNAGIGVDPLYYEPLHVEEMEEGLTLTAHEEAEESRHWREFVPVPVIECYWGHTNGRRSAGFRHRFEVRVPMIERLQPVVRRRGAAVTAPELDELLRSLSGLERERVRGYVEAIIDQRGARLAAGGARA
ncbi:helix-turn-helix domain-containing protein [Terrabacter sp. Root85]|uniref:helix-turn-helix domain-containing protein n=1 Tax=Terrabacter sp. Root85 TaxID=1736603 RepID=UPI0006FB63E4|nr:helix-turn-helix transcriptional regulator [Terrabacter sp. Root85]